MPRLAEFDICNAKLISKAENHWSTLVEFPVV